MKPLGHIFRLCFALGPLSLVALPALAKAPLVCHDLLGSPAYLQHIQVVWGEPVGEIESLGKTFSIDQIEARFAFYLGEGTEGVVYRVVPEEGQPYLLKAFFVDHLGRADSNYQESRKSLGFWSNRAQDLSFSALQVAKARKGPVKGSLALNDYRGESVYRILFSDSYSYEMREAIYRRYLTAIDGFVAAMIEQHPHLEVETYSPKISRLVETFGLPEAGYFVRALHDFEEGQTLFFDPNNIIYVVDEGIFVFIDPA